MPGCDGTGMAKRSYPSPRSGAAAGRSYPSTRSGAASERSYLVSEARVEAGRSNLTSKEPWLHGHRRASRSHLTLKVRKVGGEEIPILQGKEQRLRYAGAAVKRYPTPKIRETQVRW